ELEVAAGRLRIVPIEGLRIERAISLLSRRDHRLPRVAQAFLEMIRPQALTRPPSDAIITGS
ncbi:MAG TPA: LysR substrate-binding domain-containing protein, partial [bacterium]|nr:LysR substrate-binding domain-containing protein [bacterium]